MKLSKNAIIMGVVGLVVGAGIGYFVPHGAAGRAGASAYSRGNFTAGGTGTFTARGGNQAGGNLLTGTIASADSGSITLNTRDGSSHVVLITPDTQISKSVAGSASDLSNGSTVIVSGTTNSDGSVSATLIQLRPAGAPTGTPAASGAPMIPAQ